MKDNEIIKVLKMHLDEKDCHKCLLDSDSECLKTLLKGCNDLIKRQKTEIEKLETELADARYLNTVAADDAIKELAERLKTKWFYTFCRKVVSVEDIDNIVKEMTEVDAND